MRKRDVIGVAAAATVGVAVFALGLVLLSQSDSDAVDATDQQHVRLTIEEAGFSEPAVQIRQGTTVTWTNTTDTEDNVMGSHDGEEHVHATVDADDVDEAVFNGPALAEGESYSYTFHEVGTFTYHSALHPDKKGTIVVIE